MPAPSAPRGDCEPVTNHPNAQHLQCGSCKRTKSRNQFTKARLQKYKKLCFAQEKARQSTSSVKILCQDCGQAEHQRATQHSRQCPVCKAHKPLTTEFWSSSARQANLADAHVVCLLCNLAENIVETMRDSDSEEEMFEVFTHGPARVDSDDEAHDEAVVIRHDDVDARKQAQRDMRELANLQRLPNVLKVRKLAEEEVQRYLSLVPVRRVPLRRLEPELELEDLDPRGGRRRRPPAEPEYDSEMSEDEHVKFDGGKSVKLEVVLDSYERERLRPTIAFNELRHERDVRWRLAAKKKEEAEGDEANFEELDHFFARINIKAEENPALPEMQAAFDRMEAVDTVLRARIEASVRGEIERHGSEPRETSPLPRRTYFSQAECRNAARLPNVLRWQYKIDSGVVKSRAPEEDPGYSIVGWVKPSKTDKNGANEAKKQNGDDDDADAHTLKETDPGIQTVDAKGQEDGAPEAVDRHGSTDQAGVVSVKDEDDEQMELVRDEAEVDELLDELLDERPLM